MIRPRSHPRLDPRPPLEYRAGREHTWQDDGLCAQSDPDAFYPEKGAHNTDAKRVCKGCPVVEQCLEYALANDERFGIWGGLSERERRKLKTQRRAEGGAA